MNIAFFLVPKCNVEYLYETDTLEEGLKKLRFNGYASIPVITGEGKYAGSVSEGDFLRAVVFDSDGNILKNIVIKESENIKIKDIMRPDIISPVLITETMEKLLIRAMDQNYIPVVDDRGTFMGIITRRDIIKYFYKENFGENKQIAYYNPGLLEKVEAEMISCI